MTIFTQRQIEDRRDRMVQCLLRTPAEERRFMLMSAFQTGELRLSEADDVLRMVRRLEESGGGSADNLWLEPVAAVDPAEDAEPAAEPVAAAEPAAEPAAVPAAEPEGRPSAEVESAPAETAADLPHFNYVPDPGDAADPSGFLGTWIDPFDGALAQAEAEAAQLFDAVA